MRIDPQPSKACEHGFIFIFWQGLGLTGGIAMFLWAEDDIDTWYKSLEKETWFPDEGFYFPGYIIAATFTGSAAYGIWRYGGFSKQIVRLTLHLFQTVLAITWVPILFKSRDLLVAFVLCFMIFGASIVRTALFLKINIALAGLCLPSDIWYGFLAAVSLQLWNKNPNT